MLYILPTDTCYGIWCAFHDTDGYHRIYKLKKRDFTKPLAILVESFDWLQNNTHLTVQQIDFLKQYHRPFTILTESSPVRAYLNFSCEWEEEFINKDIYTHLSFRVAHNDFQKKLVKKIWPIWLTSANISDAWETYHPDKIEKDFWYQISTWELVFYNAWELDHTIPASDVFWFLWKNWELSYIRKY